MTGVVILGCVAVVAGFLALAGWAGLLRDAVLPDPHEERDESKLSWRSLCRDRLGVPQSHLTGPVERN